MDDRLQSRCHGLASPPKLHLGVLAAAKRLWQSRELAGAEMARKIQCLGQRHLVGPALWPGTLPDAGTGQPDLSWGLGDGAVPDLASVARRFAESIAGDAGVDADHLCPGFSVCAGRSLAGYPGGGNAAAGVRAHRQPAPGGLKRGASQFPLRSLLPAAPVLASFFDCPAFLDAACG